MDTVLRVHHEEIGLIYTTSLQRAYTRHAAGGNRSVFQFYSCSLLFNIFYCKLYALVQLDNPLNQSDSSIDEQQIGILMKRKLCPSQAP